MADDDGSILQRALTWKQAGHGVALATVVQTWGSSPRPAGSHLVIRDDALFIGSVSGGCIESEVVQEALEIMQSQQPRLFTYGVDNEQAWEAGLACGGKIQIYVEAIT